MNGVCTKRSIAAFCKVLVTSDICRMRHLCHTSGTRCRGFPPHDRWLGSLPRSIHELQSRVMTHQQPQVNFKMCIQRSHIQFLECLWSATRATVEVLTALHDRMLCRCTAVLMTQADDRNESVCRSSQAPPKPRSDHD